MLSQSKEHRVHPLTVHHILDRSIQDARMEFLRDSAKLPSEPGVRNMNYKPTGTKVHANYQGVTFGDPNLEISGPIPGAIMSLGKIRSQAGPIVREVFRSVKPLPDPLSPLDFNPNDPSLDHMWLPRHTNKVESFLTVLGANHSDRFEALCKSVLDFFVELRESDLFSTRSYSPNKQDRMFVLDECIQVLSNLKSSELVGDGYSEKLCRTLETGFNLVNNSHLLSHEELSFKSVNKENLLASLTHFRILSEAIKETSPELLATTLFDRESGHLFQFIDDGSGVQDLDNSSGRIGGLRSILGRYQDRVLAGNVSWLRTSTEMRIQNKAKIEHKKKKVKYTEDRLSSKDYEAIAHLENPENQLESLQEVNDDKYARSIEMMKGLLSNVCYQQGLSASRIVDVDYCEKKFDTLRSMKIFAFIRHIRDPESFAAMALYTLEYHENLERIVFEHQTFLGRVNDLWAASEIVYKTKILPILSMGIDDVSRVVIDDFLSTSRYSSCLYSDNNPVSGPCVNEKMTEDNSYLSARYAFLSSFDPLLSVERHIASRSSDLILKSVTIVSDKYNSGVSSIINDQSLVQLRDIGQLLEITEKTPHHSKILSELSSAQDHDYCSLPDEIFIESVVRDVSSLVDCSSLPSFTTNGPIGPSLLTILISLSEEATSHPSNPLFSELCVRRCRGLVRSCLSMSTVKPQRSKKRNHRRGIVDKGLAKDVSSHVLLIASLFRPRDVLLNLDNSDRLEAKLYNLSLLFSGDLQKIVENGFSYVAREEFFPPSKDRSDIEEMVFHYNRAKSMNLRPSDPLETLDFSVRPSPELDLLAQKAVRKSSEARENNEFLTQGWSELYLNGKAVGVHWGSMPDMKTEVDQEMMERSIKAASSQLSSETQSSSPSFIYHQNVSFAVASCLKEKFAFEEPYKGFKCDLLSFTSQIVELDSNSNKVQEGNKKSTSVDSKESIGSKKKTTKIPARVVTNPRIFEITGFNLQLKMKKLLESKNLSGIKGLTIINKYNFGVEMGLDVTSSLFSLLADRQAGIFDMDTLQNCVSNTQTDNPDNKRTISDSRFFDFAKSPYRDVLCDASNSVLTDEIQSNFRKSYEEKNKKEKMSFSTTSSKKEESKGLIHDNDVTIRPENLEDMEINSQLSQLVSKMKEDLRTDSIKTQTFIIGEFHSPFDSSKHPDLARRRTRQKSMKYKTISTHPNVEFRMVGSSIETSFNGKDLLSSSAKISDVHGRPSLISNSMFIPEEVPDNRNPRMGKTVYDPLLFRFSRTPALLYTLSSIDQNSTSKVTADGLVDKNITTLSPLLSKRKFNPVPVYNDPSVSCTMDNEHALAVSHIMTIKEMPRSSRILSYLSKSRVYHTLLAWQEAASRIPRRKPGLIHLQETHIPGLHYKFLSSGLHTKMDKGLTHITFYKQTRDDQPESEFEPIRHFTLRPSELCNMSVAADRFVSLVISVFNRKSGDDPEMVGNLIGEIILSKSWGLSRALKPFRYLVQGHVYDSPQLVSQMKKFVGSAYKKRRDFTTGETIESFDESYRKVPLVMVLDYYKPSVRGRTPLFNYSKGDLDLEAFVMNLLPSTTYGKRKHQSDAILEASEENNLYNSKFDTVKNINDDFYSRISRAFRYFKSKSLTRSEMFEVLKDELANHLEMFKGIFPETDFRFTMSPIAPFALEKYIMKSVNNTFSTARSTALGITDFATMKASFCPFTMSKLKSLQSFANIVKKFKTTVSSEIQKIIFTKLNFIPLVMRTFDKDQQGGNREISILNSVFRFVQGNAERVSRNMEEQSEYGYLSKRNKEQDLVERFKKCLKSQRRVLMTGDQTRWGPNFNTQLFKMCLYLGSRDSTECFLPSVVSSISEMKLFEVLHHPELFKEVNSCSLLPGFVARSHMGQGIFHYTSTLYHCWVLEFLRDCLRDLITQESHGKVNLTFSAMCTSDDFSLFMGLDPIQEAETDKTQRANKVSLKVFGHDEKNKLLAEVEDVVAQPTLETEEFVELEYEPEPEANSTSKELDKLESMIRSGLSFCTGSVFCYFGIKSSDYKNHLSSSSIEFNSIFLFPDSTGKNNSKFTCSLIDPLTTGDAFEDFKNAFNSYSSAVSSGLSNVEAKAIFLLNLGIKARMWRIRLEDIVLPSDLSLLSGLDCTIPRTFDTFLLVRSLLKRDSYGTQSLAATDIAEQSTDMIQKASFSIMASGLLFAVRPSDSKAFFITDKLRKMFKPKIRVDGLDYNVSLIALINCLCLNRNLKDVFLAGGLHDYSKKFFSSSVSSSRVTSLNRGFHVVNYRSCSKTDESALSLTLGCYQPVHFLSPESSYGEICLHLTRAYRRTDVSLDSETPELIEMRDKGDVFSLYKHFLEAQTKFNATSGSVRRLEYVDSPREVETIVIRGVHEAHTISNYSMEVFVFPNSTVSSTQVSQRFLSLRSSEPILSQLKRGSNSHLKTMTTINPKEVSNSSIAKIEEVLPLASKSVKSTLLAVQETISGYRERSWTTLSGKDHVSNKSRPMPTVSSSSLVTRPPSPEDSKNSKSEYFGKLHSLSIVDRLNKSLISICPSESGFTNVIDQKNPIEEVIDPFRYILNSRIFPKSREESGSFLLRSTGERELMSYEKFKCINRIASKVIGSQSQYSKTIIEASKNPDVSVEFLEWKRSVRVMKMIFDYLDSGLHKSESEEALLIPGYLSLKEIKGEGLESPESASTSLISFPTVKEEALRDKLPKVEKNTSLEMTTRMTFNPHDSKVLSRDRTVTVVDDKKPLFFLFRTPRTSLDEINKIIDKGSLVLLNDHNSERVVSDWRKGNDPAEFGRQKLSAEELKEAIKVSKEGGLFEEKDEMMEPKELVVKDDEDANRDDDDLFADAKDQMSTNKSLLRPESEFLDDGDDPFGDIFNSLFEETFVSSDVNDIISEAVLDDLRCMMSSSELASHESFFSDQILEDASVDSSSLDPSTKEDLKYLSSVLQKTETSEMKEILKKRLVTKKEVRISSAHFCRVPDGFKYLHRETMRRGYAVSLLGNMISTGAVLLQENVVSNKKDLEWKTIEFQETQNLEMRLSSCLHDRDLTDPLYRNWILESEKKRLLLSKCVISSTINLLRRENCLQTTEIGDENTEMTFDPEGGCSPGVLLANLKRCVSFSELGASFPRHSNFFDIAANLQRTMPKDFYNMPAQLRLVTDERNWLIVSNTLKTIASSLQPHSLPMSEFVLHLRDPFNPNVFELPEGIRVVTRKEMYSIMRGSREISVLSDLEKWIETVLEDKDKCDKFRKRTESDKKEILKRPSIMDSLRDLAVDKSSFDFVMGDLAN